MLSETIGGNSLQEHAYCFFKGQLARGYDVYRFYQKTNALGTFLNQSQDPPIAEPQQYGGGQG